MSIRRHMDAQVEAEVQRATLPPVTQEPRSISTPASPAPVKIIGALTREEAEGQYATARDAWTAAMRRANSGRPADLASLAIAQEAYEAAAAEVQLWRSGARIALPVQADRNSGIETAVGQELAWRRVLHHEDKPKGLLARLFGRSRSR